MSTPETLTRELAALDDALAGRPVDPDLADLAELAVLVRDERPVPDPAFAHSLDERARRGFPRSPKRRRGVLVAAVHAARARRRRVACSSSWSSPRRSRRRQERRQRGAGGGGVGVRARPAPDTDEADASPEQPLRRQDSAGGAAVLASPRRPCRRSPAT